MQARRSLIWERSLPGALENRVHAMAILPYLKVLLPTFFVLPIP